MVHKLLKIFIISVILLKMVKHSDFHLSFSLIVGALPGFQTIVRKSTPRFTRFLSLVLIRLVLTEIQRFKNVKIYKEMYGIRTQRPDCHTFLCKF